MLSPTSVTVTRTLSNRDKKEKASLSRNSSNKDRDCVKYINERNSNNVSCVKSNCLPISHHSFSLQLKDMDDDSEAEKLSPLLVNGVADEKDSSPKIALHIDGVESSIDTDTEADLDEPKVRPLYISESRFFNCFFLHRKKLPTNWIRKR